MPLQGHVITFHLPLNGKAGDCAIEAKLGTAGTPLTAPISSKQALRDTLHSLPIFDKEIPVDSFNVLDYNQGQVMVFINAVDGERKIIGYSLIAETKELIEIDEPVSHFSLTYLAHLAWYYMQYCSHFLFATPAPSWQHPTTRQYYKAYKLGPTGAVAEHADKGLMTQTNFAKIIGFQWQYTKALCRWYLSLGWLRGTKPPGKVVLGTNCNWISIGRMKNACGEITNVNLRQAFIDRIYVNDKIVDRPPAASNAFCYLDWQPLPDTDKRGALDTLQGKNLAEWYNHFYQQQARSRQLYRLEHFARLYQSYIQESDSHKKQLMWEKPNHWDRLYIHHVNWWCLLVFGLRVRFPCFRRINTTLPTPNEIVETKENIVTRLSTSPTPDGTRTTDGQAPQSLATGKLITERWVEPDEAQKPLASNMDLRPLLRLGVSG